jgi:uncharacterized membrane protein
MRRFLRTAAVTLSSLVLFGVAVALVGYHFAINRPGQGGWDLYRVREIAPQFLPFLLFGTSALVVALKGLGHAFSPAALTAFTLSGLYALVLSGAAFVRIPQTWVFFSLIAATTLCVVLTLVFGFRKTSGA